MTGVTLICAPFNTELVLVCVQVDGQTLVGDRKMTRNWRECFPEFSAAQGKVVTLRFDTEAIWLVTNKGKEFGFHQRYDEDLMHSPVCTAGDSPRKGSAESGVNVAQKRYTPPPFSGSLATGFLVGRRVEMS